LHKAADLLFIYKFKIIPLNYIFIFLKYYFVIMSNAKEFVSVVGDAIGPYIPLIQTASSLITKIIEICEAAEYNQKICNALAERVGVTRASMELLKLRKQKNEKELRSQSYYDAFNKFNDVLREIKEYTADVSKIHGFRKYMKAISVEEKFKKLTEKYDNTMKDLHFTMAVDDEERRRDDAEALADVFTEFENYLKTVDNKADNIYEEVMYIKNHLDDKKFHGANKIDSKDLLLPACGRTDDNRGKKPNFVVRRTLNGQEVACKSISMTEKEMKSNTKVQGHLEILMKLSECNHILKFYGISKIDNNNVMVFEWAHLGTLKELYENKDINWHYKVRIALKICRGLVFLQNAGILHHDLRCENILMTESLEPKIYNFNLARYICSEMTTTLDVKVSDDTVRWLAPEKLINFTSRYTTQCEIFSFGVLLWELAFEKIPYGSLKLDDVRDFVINGGRERIRFGDTTHEISKLQGAYKKIIIDSMYYFSSGIFINKNIFINFFFIYLAWKQNPQERISFLKAFDKLDELHNTISHMFDENVPALLNDKTLDFDGSKSDLALPDEVIKPIIQVIPLDKGILAHDTGDHKSAWKCFEYHAGNNNATAKTWKGYYLWKGYNDGGERREEGIELLKKAADEGHPDAQLYYAFTFKNSIKEGKDIDTFIDYITKAAEGDNVIAQYNLGEIYYTGRFNVPKDEDKGIKWLRMAALRENLKAIGFLEEKGISLYRTY
jgi:serine/threonine protein kinase